MCPPPLRVDLPGALELRRSSRWAADFKQSSASPAVSVGMKTISFFLLLLLLSALRVQSDPWGAVSPRCFLIQTPNHRGFHTWESRCRSPLSQETVRAKVARKRRFIEAQLEAFNETLLIWKGGSFPVRGETTANKRKVTNLCLILHRLMSERVFKGRVQHFLTERRERNFR